MKRITNILKELWRSIRKPEMLILPGNLAFFLVMSIVPIVTLFGIIASIFSLSTDLLINLVSEFFPNDVVNILLPFIDGSNLSANNILFTIVGFYLSSNGPDSLIVASNLLYHTENDNYVFRRVKSLVMTFFMIILFIFILLFLAFGNLIIGWLAGFEVIGKFIANSYIFIIIFKFIIAFGVVFIILKILYTLAPNKKVKSKYVNKGSFVATLLILLVTSIYSYYVTNIAHYDIIYGSLSNIIILIFLIYIISYIITLGIAINSNYYNMDSIDNKK